MKREVLIFGNTSLVAPYLAIFLSSTEGPTMEAQYSKKTKTNLTKFSGYQEIFCWSSLYPLKNFFNE